ncbi:MAG: insulinase family protein [Oligoflexia bacterium]|nr:insulinase family protein [Oligoflexia bacterium]
MLKLILHLVILSSSSTLYAQQFGFEVFKKIYPNGLTLLVHEKKDIPTISVYSWFKVGSKNEEAGKTGLAHFFEHLMFSGTEKYPEKKFTEYMEQKGMTYNAFTNQDSTVYFEQLPQSELEFILDFESDRLKNLKISPDKFEIEKKVILEERLKRLEDSVDGLLNFELYNNLFIAHPYKNPIIGLKEDIKNLTLEDANNFFKKHYKPSNLIISVVGNVNAKEAQALVEKYYADIKNEPSHDTNKLSVTELSEDKKVVLKKDIEAEKLTIAYKIGNIGEKESYAFDILNQILSGDKSSRLYKRLVLHGNLVNYINSSAYNFLDSGIFEINAVLKDKSNKQDVIKVIDEELKKLIETPVSIKELQKAQLYLTKDYLKSLRTNQNRARFLALNEALLGDYKRLFTDIDFYQTITINDVQSAAQSRLLNKKRVLLELSKNE